MRTKALSDLPYRMAAVSFGRMANPADVATHFPTATIPHMKTAVPETGTAVSWKLSEEGFRQGSKTNVADNPVSRGLFTSCKAETREAEAEDGKGAGFGDSHVPYQEGLG